jgi:hypothetical protein
MLGEANRFGWLCIALAELYPSPRQTAQEKDPQIWHGSEYPLHWTQRDLVSHQSVIWHSGLSMCITKSLLSLFLY